MNVLIIPIVLSNLELIQFLNNGGPVLIESKPTYFVIDSDGNADIINLQQLAEMDELETKDVIIYYA